MSAFLKRVFGFSSSVLKARQTRAYDRYRGLLYVSTPISCAALLLLTLFFTAFWLWTWHAYPWTIAKTFWWTHPKYWLAAAGLILFLALLPWVSIPLIVSTTQANIDRYVFRRSTWVLRCLILLGMTAVTLATAVLAFPALVLACKKNGIDLNRLWLAASLPTTAPAAYHLVMALIDFAGSAFPQPPRVRLTDFPLLRPQNSKVLNLDIGGMASRLNRVIEITESWTRSAEEWPLTSGLVQDYAAEGPGDSHRAWQGKGWSTVWRGVAHLRSQLANHLEVQDQEVVFLTSTIRALEAALEALRPSVIVTTDQEHPSERQFLALLTAKYQTTVQTVPVCDAADLGQLKDRILAKCRAHPSAVLLLSHVCYATGWVLPVEEVCREADALPNPPAVVIDGAHAVGQILVNLSRFRFHFYAFCGHKWLFGPPTLGVLVTGPSAVADPKLMGRLSQEVHEAFAFQNRRVDESTSSVSIDPFVGLAASFSGLLEADFALVVQNLERLNALFVRLAGEANNIDILASPGLKTSHGIVNVQRKERPLDGPGLRRARAKLEREDQVVTRVVSPGHQPALRVCLPFYLRREEVEWAVEAIKTTFAEIP